MEKLAIIGSGIAGMGCAHFLHKKYDITVLEQDDYIGGHTNTISVDEEGSNVYFDTGFMVFNYQTYPRLCKLFETLHAPVKKTDMSFSVQHVASGLEYNGSGLNGLFAQRKNLLNIPFIRMLKEIDRFNKESVFILDDPEYAEYSLAQYIRKAGFGEDMLWKYLIPMSSAVWSTPMEEMLDFPVVSLVRFFQNHGFLGLNTQHQWYTLENGSRSYRELLIQPYRDRILTNSGVDKVSTENGKALVHLRNGSGQVYDKVIFASHADQTLNMLAQPTDEEQNLLKHFKYQKNIATVHTDEAVMPRTRRAWASWNYRIDQQGQKLLPSTVYWMNSLQGVSRKKNYFVSIGNPGIVSEEKIIRSIEYEHPLFDVPAMKAQRELPRLNEKGPLYFCGSYFKYGFHEDAFASAETLSLTL
ncbi:MAG TPA: FAD-dependent oxidoreductase [Bacteroidia bacterium]|jgi:predicted NAD/FAD-binding protein|nr:FAD-dependent oxidoreductase [Bacteroidia bacterium]